jgi:hypothetical protein
MHDFARGGSRDVVWVLAEVLREGHVSLSVASERLRDEISFKSGAVIARSSFAKLV